VGLLVLFWGFVVDGFDVDVSVFEGEFFAAFWASAVESLYDFVWWGQFDAFV
jgi:hypothetical protein